LTQLEAEQQAACGIDEMILGSVRAQQVAVQMLHRLGGVVTGWKVKPISSNVITLAALKDVSDRAQRQSKFATFQLAIFQPAAA
jgi:hypothetical protein